MNFKVLYLVFLCLFTASIICNVSMIMLNAAEAYTCRASTNAVHPGYLAVNGTEPQMGDPTDGGWP